MATESATQKQKKSSPKKTYHSPKLTVRNSIAQVTQARTNQGASDGAHGWAHAS